MKRTSVPFVLPLLFIALIAACSGDPVGPTPMTETPSSLQAGTPDSSQPTTTTPTPTHTLPPTEIPPTAEEVWVNDRVEAVVALFDITQEGKEALARLDFRWMKDQPGFFGSFGYKSWTGVGEAKPKGVIHELGHAYWGLFPITGLSQLSWDRSSRQDTSPAMQQYHQDVLEFMGQPPDHWEPLRRRLRDIPEISSANTEPVFHHIEANAVHTIGGDLELLPPILRKYWDQFLQPGPFHSWKEALAWYTSLDEGNKKVADKYVGFEHLDARIYESIKSRDSAQVEDEFEELLVREEKQRLRDFADLFDLLLGSPEHKEDFDFWRRYLRDKTDLHKEYPELIASLSSPRSEQISASLDFLVLLKTIEKNDRAELVATEVMEQPFLVNFLPSLEDRILREIFSSGVELPDGPTLNSAARFVESLEKFTPHINRIIGEGQKEIPKGVEELMAYLDSADFGEKGDMKLFFDILRGSDEETAKKVVASLDDSVLRRLLEPIPAKLRSFLDPPRFLEFLNIATESSQRDLARGIEDMIKFPSGNFRIDEPFLDEMYKVIADRSHNEPSEILEAITNPSFPIERFLRLHPEAAVDLLGQDIETTTEMVKSSDPVILPPAKFVYRLIYADPEFAARILQHLDGQAEEALVTEALAHFAYDADRLETIPGLPISLEKDGMFLAALLQDRGTDWLEERMRGVVQVFEQRIEQGQAPGDFLLAYQNTLNTAASTIEEGSARHQLEDLITRVLP